MEESKNYKISVYLHSQEQPIIYEDNYLWSLDAGNLNDPRNGEFINLGKNVVRKLDILKIIVEEIKDIKNEKQEKNGE